MRVVVDFSGVGVGARSTYLRLYPAGPIERVPVREVLENRFTTGSVSLPGLLMDCPSRDFDNPTHQVYLELWYEDGAIAYSQLRAFLQEVPYAYKMEVTEPVDLRRLGPQDLRLLERIREDPFVIPPPMHDAIRMAQAALIITRAEHGFTTFAPRSDLELLAMLDRTIDYARFVMEYLRQNNARIPSRLAQSIDDQQASQADLDALWKLAATTAQAVAAEPK